MKKLFILVGVVALVVVLMSLSVGVVLTGQISDNTGTADEGTLSMEWFTLEQYHELFAGQGDGIIKCGPH